MPFRIASLSLQGKRASNQDRIFFTPDNNPDGAIIAAVADGLGGMQAGDKAAQIAVDTLGESAEAILGQMLGTFDQASRFSAGIFQSANDRIGDWALKYASPGMVGTTLVALMVSGTRFMVANIGDSRCYRMDGNSVEQITRDHTVAESLLRQGAITLADYESSPLRNHLLRSLGPKPTSEPEFFPHMEFGMANPECTFLLCSDGFYSKLKESDFLKLQDRSEDLSNILEGLADDALKRDSTDNVSAVAVRFEK